MGKLKCGVLSVSAIYLTTIVGCSASTDGGGTAPIGVGGAGNPAGGAGNPSAGAPNPSGGAPNPFGGAPNPSGGAPNPSGGAPNPSGGAPNPSGGAPNPSGGAPSGGAPNPSGGAAGTPVTSCGTADCWTYLGHDAHSTFFNPTEKKITPANVATLKVLSGFPVNIGSSACGTAAVVGDTIYAKGSSNTVAINRATGAVKWTNAIGGSGSVTYDNGKLYLQHPKGQIERVDAATGKQDWQVDINGGVTNSIGTPFVYNGVVYAGTSSSNEFSNGGGGFKGKVVALNKDTGATIWSHTTIDGAGDGAPVWASGSADGTIGYFAAGNNYSAVGGDADSIFALDLTTGTKLWAYAGYKNDTFNSLTAKDGIDNDFGANPILFEAAGKKLVGAGEKSGVFHALDRATGKPVWTTPVTDKGCRLGGILNNGAYDGQRIYVSSFPCDSNLDFGIPFMTAGQTVAAALDPATGNVLWKVNMPENSWGPVTVANGVVFVPANKSMYFLNAATGATIGKFDTPGSIASGAVVVDGQVFFGSGLPAGDAFSLVGATDGSSFYGLGLP